ncbi:PDDEXK nuclease domain-containing protein [Legionella pneumophila serogroup 1]
MKAHERSVENALIIHVRDFLIELGQGFAFVGSQVLLTFDDQLRKPGNNQTIGILLCKSKNKVMAEYALRNISAPIGVSEYTLSKSIPTDLKGSLLTIEEIEAELNESVKED